MKEVVKLVDAALQEMHREMRGRPPEHWVNSIAIVHKAVGSDNRDEQMQALRAAHEELTWAKEQRCPAHLWQSALAAVEDEL